jgi:hypothetical protein
MAAKRKGYRFPAFVSAFVVGLGQIIKGDNKKGLKMMLWFYLGLPIIICGVFVLNAYIFLAVLALYVVMYPVFWILNILDAYNAQRRQRSQ